VRIGAVRLRLRSVPDAIPHRPDLAWPGDADPTWELPIALDAPGRMSVVIDAPPDRRADGLRILQAAVARILADLPPGKARFTFVDPVGLGQSFAGFMHLADESVQLVNDRIWTDPRHVEQRLADLTEHMETVIQKYLRNEYASLEEYNRKAGEIAEPYRFLVMADFPANVTEGAAKRLASVLQSGARCGVHVLLLRDPRQPLPPGLDEGDLRRAARTVAWATGPDGWAVDDGHLAGLRMEPDAAPDDGTVLALTKAVGRAARDSSRVEVPFAMVAPEPSQRWTLSTARSLRVPIGRSGATRLQYMTLGEGTSQHALVAGKTGSGKSSLLNALIVNVALWHSPDEVELWLIDFKKGVEFKAYASSGLPHIRAVAVESDREFGLSILQGLDEELRRRGELFRGANVQNLTDWRALGRPERMPRCLLVVDEFQELFIEDDKVAQDAALLLDRLVRQGRAFGMHAVLGSQTLGGAYGIARSTMGQMGIRIALQCSEADSQLILSDDNGAARLLSRPGEAIYNDAGGLVEGNNPFQVVWLGDEERARLLEVASKAPADGARPLPIVFEGNQPAEPRANGPLERAIAGPAAGAELAPRVWVGDAVSIRDPSNAVLARRPGANVAVIAQAAESGTATLAMGMVSLAAQLPAARARFVVLDGMSAGEQPTASLAAVRDAIPHPSESHGIREADAAVMALAEEVARRVAAGSTAEPAAFLVVNGLHRFRSLRRNENDFSLGDGPPTPDKALGAILREGPAVGVHCLLWVDTAANLQRSVDRATMRDLNFKALFQMSVSDSSTLIDSPAASRLGMHRAILADDDAGTSEKFRPYGMPDDAYLRHVSAALRARPG
jgi:energy-coupling factor transporter ATP-binding protein EcfA2